MFTLKIPRAGSMRPNVTTRLLHMEK